MLSRLTRLFSSMPKALWSGSLAVPLSTGLAFLLYWWTAAPGLSWAHQGADGGELLAAAVRNGVPHPPGYPFYVWLLQGWLSATGLLWPNSEIAWRGNLLSVLCAAASVGITVLVAGQGLPWTVSTVQPPEAKAVSLPVAPTAIVAQSRWVWATIAGLAWAISPLLWGQALITEVYALHALLIALLGWALLVKNAQARFLIPIVALGVAHHLTFVLLLPAALYYIWVKRGGGLNHLLQAIGVLTVGGLLGILFYARIWLVAGAAPPVNWGYADNWAGFWWLISGAAYRGYLFSAPSATVPGRIAAWAYTLTSQYTPVGLGIALLGLSDWDRYKPQLRNFSLLWIVPVSIYAIGYYTRDSEIYLLPVIWLATLWLAAGIPVILFWLFARWPRLGIVPIAASTLLIALVILIAVRWPSLSLRHDQEARQYIADVNEILEPGSIVISRADHDTFALWYSAWASGELLRNAPDTVLINDGLYQFPWYQRLLATLYPTVVSESHSVQEILAANHGKHPIFFTQDLGLVPTEQLETVGPLWRYK